MSTSRLHGWRSEQRVSPLGSVESTQRALIGSLVVPGTTAGAARLGDVYWAEVVRFTRGLVRARVGGAGVELRVLGGGPTLLRFGPPVLAVSDAVTSCTYPIHGGGLARRPGGEIAFQQAAGPEIELSSLIRGFFPALAAPAGAPRWAGVLYSHGQRRLHQAISRRYFMRLIAEAAA